MKSQNGQSLSVAMESGFMESECLEVGASGHFGVMGIVHSSVVVIVMGVHVFNKIIKLYA